MNRHLNIKHLASLCDILRDRTNEVIDMSRRSWELMAKETELTDKFADKRLCDVEALLRSLSVRCLRLADEVATLKGK